MKLKTLLIALLGAAWLLPAGALAEGPTGIGFAVAPENSSAYCMAGNPDAAFSCARDKCAAAGDGITPGDCLRVKWCYPAGWSGDVFTQLKEGFHSHEYLCGYATREILEAVVKALCDPALNPYFSECKLVRIVDPEGNEVLPE